MSNKGRPGFGGRILLLIAELLVAAVILYGVARILPKGLTISSIGSDISSSLLIPTQSPSAAPSEQPTEAPTALPMTETGLIDPEASANPVDVQATETGITAETPTITGEIGGTGTPETDQPAATEQPAMQTQPLSEPVQLTISAAGDCTLGGDPNNGGLSRFTKAFEGYGAEYFLQSVAPIFEADDLTIVNLEGALTNETAGKQKEFAFRGNPKFVQILTEGGVDLVSIDNNHSQDYYSQGLADTKKTLDYVGIGYAGLGTSYKTEIKGVSVGFLSYRVWDMTVEGMTSDIQALKQECDLVIVAVHWGDEKVGRANNTQIKLGHAAVDAGADLVLGHHPHVVGSIELYNGKYIVYSLGNFCFGGNSNPDDKDTFIFQQTFTFESGSVTGTDISVIPCTISSSATTNDYQPTPVAYEEGGKAILKKIVDRSTQFESTPDWDAVIAKLQ